MIPLLLALAAGAADADADASEGEVTEKRVQAKASGHVKAFAIGIIPYDHPLMPPAPAGQAFLDGRLNGRLDIGQNVTIEAAHAVTATLGASSGVGVIGTGVAPNAPQLVDLGWEALDPEGEDSTFTLIGRTDRLVVRGSLTGLDVAVGRQPISFGSGLFFTPLDLVNPFTPATIDSEYKPGVDAIRVDVYKGVSAKGTAVVTWAGQPPGSDAFDADPAEGLELLTGAAYGQATVGVTDVGLFAGSIRGDAVFGTVVVTSIGPVGVHGDLAVTVPIADEEEEPFVRAVVGANAVPWWRLNVMGEVYVQTLGSTEPADLFTTLQKDRWARGELWLGGVAYAGLSASLEVTPLVFVSVATFANLTDPSGFLTMSLSWSVAENAEVAAGAYLGLGQRPGALTDPGFGLRSEFGTYPAVTFVQVKTYF